MGLRKTFTNEEIQDYQANPEKIEFLLKDRENLRARLHKLEKPKS